MGFSDATRKEAMGKAGYCCCICHLASVSVEVHHITPEGEGGNDLIENAAPLCPNCHSDYGGNPQKRTRIRQMRDWWYKQTEKVYSGNITNPEQLRLIHVTLQNMNIKQDSILNKQNKHDSDLMNLKSQLKIIANKTIDNMTSVTSDITTAGVLSTAASSISSLRSGSIECYRCHLLIDGRNAICPHCGFCLDD